MRIWRRVSGGVFVMCKLKGMVESPSENQHRFRDFRFSFSLFIFKRQTDFTQNIMWSDLASQIHKVPMGMENVFMSGLTTLTLSGCGI